MRWRYYVALLALAAQLGGIAYLAWPTLRTTWYGKTVVLELAGADSSNVESHLHGDDSLAWVAARGLLNPESFRRLHLSPEIDHRASTLPGWQTGQETAVDAECFVVLRSPQSDHDTCWEGVSCQNRHPGPLPEGQVAIRLQLRRGLRSVLLANWTVPEDLWREAKLEFPLRARGCMCGAEFWQLGCTVLSMLEHQDIELRVDEQGNAILYRVVIPNQESRLSWLMSSSSPGPR